MFKRFLVPILLLSFGVTGISSEAPKTKTVKIQPDANTGKDAFVWYVDPSGSYPDKSTNNYGDHSSLFLFEWTFQGSKGSERVLIDFDLGEIPAGVIITEASLQLKHNPNTSEGGHSGDNAFTISRITSSWDEDLVNWQNQPEFTSENQSFIPKASSSTQDYDLDVLQLVQDMIDDPENSHGFILEMQTNQPYRSLVLASSNHPNAELRPSLTLTYELPESGCLSLQPDSLEGKDAFVWYVDPSGSYPDKSSKNFGNHPSLFVYEWTFEGSQGSEKAFIDFDLSSIPEGAAISKATLSLFYDSTSNEGGHSGDNSFIVSKISTAWNEDSVTWQNQPNISKEHQVFVPKTDSSNQNFNLDVVQLVQDMVDNPADGHGFQIEMQTNAPYRSLVIASSNNIIPELRPKLEVCYEFRKITSTSDFVSEEELVLYPNPSHGIINTESDHETSQIEVLSLYGEKLLTIEKPDSQIDISILPSGTYMLVLRNQDGSTKTQKVVLRK